MSKRVKVFNVGDEVAIHSREYGEHGRIGVIDSIRPSRDNNGVRNKYRYVVYSRNSRAMIDGMYDLCPAEMRKISSAPLNILEDWS